MAKLLKSILYFAIFAILLQLMSSCRGKHNLTKIFHKKQDTLANFPYWIAMMDSPNVNYYKAVEAFDKYWENREKPTEADGEGKDIFNAEKSNEQKEKKRSIQYIYEYKQFLNWQQRNKNLVKPDGTIMTPEEILEQWNKNNKP